MTEYEAMKTYGDDEGYIGCDRCPCYSEDGCSVNDFHCNGTTDAYRGIVKFFNGETSTEPTKTDMVNHPPHYTQDGIECIDEMIMVFGEATVMDFCLCNVWKYRKRALLKNGQEDLDKANWYMKKYKELLENAD